MRMSKMLGRRIKEDPKDAKTVSHKFLVRGGYIRGVSAGIYSMLPLGMRIIEKIEAIIRKHILFIAAFSKKHYPDFDSVVKELDH